MPFVKSDARARPQFFEWEAACTSCTRSPSTPRATVPPTAGRWRMPQHG
ncbi:hypothetical protein [Rathayibacter rathayi]|nr:hypothetical protein [Rathayibacter rathayi]